MIPKIENVHIGNVPEGEKPVIRLMWTEKSFNGEVMSYDGFGNLPFYLSSETFNQFGSDTFKRRFKTFEP